MIQQADAANYRSAEFQQLENMHVFDKAWLVAGPVWRVQNPGDYFTFDQQGRSIVVARQDDGELRAFYNSCLHRGTRLLNGHGNLAEITCPYHGWRYGRDGALQHVPEPEGIDIGDCSKLRLAPVHVAERMGLVWLNVQEGPDDLDAWLGELPEQLAPYQLEDMRPIQEKTWTLNCNWKAVLENATEAYHLEAVHGMSVNSRVNEKPDFVGFGDHARLSLAIAPYQWRRWIDKLTSRGGPYTQRQWDALQKYWLFPNTIVNVIPCHMTIFQTWPVAPDRCLFFYGFYGRKNAWPLEWLRARASWLFSRWVLREDMRIIEMFQHGSENTSFTTHRFHQSEMAASHHQYVLQHWIARGRVEAGRGIV